jgi:two-component system, NtrC family, response regulator PilR
MRVVVADHSPDSIGLYSEYVPGYVLEFCTSGDGVLRLLRQQRETDDRIVLVILLWQLPQASIVVRALREEFSDVRFIAVDATPNPKTLHAAMLNGAVDAFDRPFTEERLLDAVRDATGESPLTALTEGLHQRLIGQSRAWKTALHELARAIHAQFGPVLLLGEPGVGKELAARAVHDLSNRQGRKFVAVNAVSGSSDMWESQLFGHEKGSFTGAFERHIGYFEEVGDGTLFIDEIGELPLNLQSKLLRVLQEKTFRRMGRTVDLTLKARLVFATNRDLDQAIVEKTFRGDLRDRIKAHVVRLPSLRERHNDWLVLIAHFFEKHAAGRQLTLTNEVRAILHGYDFPGNARELEQIVLAIIARHPDREICLRHLPVEFFGARASANDSDSVAWPEHVIEQPYKQAKGDAINCFNVAYSAYARRVLEKHNGHKGKTAKELGVTNKTLKDLLDSPS